MNPLIVKILSSLIDFKADASNGAATSKKGSDHLFRDILKSISDAQNHSSSAEAAFKTAPNSGSSAFRRSLSSLQHAFRAKGIPLNKVHLKREHLPVLKEFLFRCNVAPKEADQILKDFMDNDIGGEINLFSFFQKIEELAGTDTNKRRTVRVETAMVPHLESVLRRFDLPPQKLERAFDASKTPDGHLDLARLAARLKSIGASSKQSKTAAAEPVFHGRDLQRLEAMGIEMPQSAKDGRVSLNAFVRSLEKAASAANGETRVPVEMKALIDRISEEAVVAGAKPSAVVTESHTDMLKGDMLRTFRGRRPSGPKEKNMPSLRSKSGVRLNDGNGEKAAVVAEHNKQAVHASAKAVSQGVREHGRVSSEPGRIGGKNPPTETRTPPMVQQPVVSDFAEAIHTVRSTEKPMQEFLPAYLVDQVGTRISRALSRGDRVVRLNLKPPELGALKLEIDIQDNTLKLGVLAENNSVRELLLANVHELKEALIEQNVRLEKIDVQIGHEFGQSLAGSQQGRHRGGGGRREFGKGMIKANSDSAVLQPIGPGGNNASRLLDLVA